MSSKVSSKKLTIRYLLYQVAYYATCVGTSAFATTYLLEKGFSTSAIGIVIAATNILSCILQPRLGDVVDRLKKFVLPQMMIGFLASALVCFAVIQFCKPSLGIFGILQNQMLFILFVVSILVLVVVYFLIKLPDKARFTKLHMVLSVLLAGSFGNLIDRIRFGYVIDFIYFVGIDFPIFNVADIMISVATILLIVLFVFYYKEKDLEFLTFKQKRYRELK